ncbi:MAG: MFS transporter [bacterium]|nr:MFS transporter [bacterium]
MAGPWAVLLLLCFVQLMTVIDGTVVNVALPSISRDLSFGPGEVQWVLTVYLLCTGGMMLLSGRVADRFGPRRVLRLGTALFAAASLCSGLAPHPLVLIVGRGAQGAGAALMTPAALSIVTTMYTGARRAAALGTWGAVASGGFVAGLLVGGVLTTALSWRWIFFVNVPISILVLALVPLLVAADRTDREAQESRLPVLGAVALTAGLVAIVFAISAPQGLGAAGELGALGVGFGLLAGFVLLDRRSDHPMLAPALLRTRSLVTGSALMFVTTGVLVGVLFVTTFFLQERVHASPLVTGLDYLPFGVTIALASQFAPRLLRRFGTRVTGTAGLFLVAAGALFLSATAGSTGYVTSLLPAFLLLGGGTGLAIVSASNTAMAHVPSEHAGAASGLLMTGHEAGAALGVAVLSAIAAAAAQGAGGMRIGDGYPLALTVTAGLAAALALLTAWAMPSVRPPMAAGGHPQH